MATREKNVPSLACQQQGYGILFPSMQLEIELLACLRPALPCPQLVVQVLCCATPHGGPLFLGDRSDNAGPS